MNNSSSIYVYYSEIYYALQAIKTSAAFRAMAPRLAAAIHVTSHYPQSFRLLQESNDQSQVRCQKREKERERKKKREREIIIIMIMIITILIKI